MDNAFKLLQAMSVISMAITGFGSLCCFCALLMDSFALSKEDDPHSIYDLSRRVVVQRSYRIEKRRFAWWFTIFALSIAIYLVASPAQP